MSLAKSLQKVVNFLGKSSGFGNTMKGMKIISAEPGQVRCQLKVKPAHLNSVGILHGGMVCTLADAVSTYAIGTTKGEKFGVSVDLNISFLSSALPGENLIIDSKVLRTGENLAFADISISKEDGKLVATARHTKYLNAGSKMSNFELEDMQ